MAKKEDQAERIISKSRLDQLVKMHIAAASRIATERGALGEKIKRAVEEEHLDPWAFGVYARLKKMDGALATRRLRNLMVYCDRDDVLGKQIDLEDYSEKNAAEDREAVDEVLNGAGEADEFEDPPRDANPDSAGALAEFRQTIAPAGDQTAVQVELNRFVKAHPELAAQAEEIASERAAALAAAPPKAKRGRKSAPEHIGEFGSGLPH